MTEEIDYDKLATNLIEVRHFLYEINNFNGSLKKTSAKCNVKGFAKIVRGGDMIERIVSEMSDLIDEKLPIVRRKAEKICQAKRKIRKKGYVFTYFFHDERGKKIGEQDTVFSDWSLDEAKKRSEDEIKEFAKDEKGHSFYRKRAPESAASMTVGKVTPWIESDEEYEKRLSRKSDFL